MSSFHPLSIQKINRETAQSISIVFNLPKALIETFQFKAGQYITLKTNLNGNEIRRDYSLCASPKSNLLKIAIKEINQGGFSVYANQYLKEGDIVEVAPPKGRFTFAPNDGITKNIALFAAGSGITPILSIIKCALEEEQHSHVILVYGNKSVPDTMFLNELLELQHQYKERFSIQFVFSQSDEENAIFGRIEKSTINFVLLNKYKHITVDAYYICGPEGMIHTVKNVLSENQVEDRKIHFELFKASKTDVVVSSPSNSNKSSITIVVDSDETTIEMSQNQTILEAAIDEDIDVPYSCQGGICGSCIARVKEGEVTMRQNNILTDSEVAEGLILTCQAQPCSAKVIVDYDDI